MYKGINFISFKSYSVTKSPNKKKKTGINELLTMTTLQMLSSFCHFCISLCSSSELSLTGPERDMTTLSASLCMSIHGYQSQNGKSLSPSRLSGVLTGWTVTDWGLAFSSGVRNSLSSTHTDKDKNTVASVMCDPVGLNSLYIITGFLGLWWKDEWGFFL